MKFGGTSVGDRDRVAHVAHLVHRHDEPVVVVVSAMGKTTDHLLGAARAAERGRWATANERVDELQAFHLQATDDADAASEIERLCTELRHVLQGVYLLREQTDRSRALISSFGERLSVLVLAAHIRALGRPAEAVDSRQFVVTSGPFLGARVELEDTFRNAVAILEPLVEAGTVPVVTGFIGATENGITTTLGRGGSDYSAALIGSLLAAQEIWIWTDVDGILTADPRLVSEARTLSQVSYREAAEMSYFGARVLHPKTMLPAMSQGIPIRIRGTFSPDSPGTVVAENSPSLPQGVKTVTSVHDQAILTIDGRGMAGVPGFARRIFTTTEDSGVNVVMISQASSEQTVSLVVDGSDASRLVSALRETFELELNAGLIERIEARADVAVVSIIGQGMAGTPGVSGRFFGALGQVSVNVLAIAQGASELSISVAIDQAGATRAVRAVHTAFGLTRVVHVVVVGCGRVGRSLLGMLQDTRESLAREHRLDLRLVGVANSTRFMFAHDGIDPTTAADAIKHAEVRPPDAALIDAIVEERFTDVILVDVSAAPLVNLHRLALEAGFHVVTANKVPLSGPLDEYRALVNAKNASGVVYGYETTFGAGLPVLHTLKDLLHTGDELLSVSGCFSGTLGFLCTRVQDGMSLSAAVAEAVEAGFTEPDPREDLSGRDVARKALIIARAMGRSLQPDDIELEAMVPGLEDGLDQAVEAHSPVMAERIAACAERGEVLRYVATIDADGVRVGLQAVPAAGPIGALRGPDNILVFRTRRYDANPLVIRGPGAGAEVTAAGVLGDIIRVVT